MKQQKYKNKGKVSLFDKQEAAEKLTNIGNPLSKINNVFDFEMFRDEIEAALLNTDKKSNAGAKPYDLVMMFKIMFIQRFYNLSDEQMEYQIIDRLSFKNFLELQSGDKVPDQKTIWLFRENLTKSGLVEVLFAKFNHFLESNNLIMNEGKMVDGTFTPIPRQRNTREENEKIKAGQGNELWNDNKHKKCHKDIDARWTKKNNETFYGYKNHIKSDTKTKFIDTYTVTDASVHDSQPLDELLTEQDANQNLYADSAYTGPKQDQVIEKRKMINQVNEKGARNKPLTDSQKANNRTKSKTRSRVEHVFGFMEQSMHGLMLNSVGIVRATGIIGMINLVYNIFRYEQVKRLDLKF